MLDFYKNKRVLITGHSGFKGAWLSRILINAGAKVTGYSLCPPTDPALFNISDIERHMVSIIGDIRDLNNLRKVVTEAEPEIVLHLAAQPLVRDSYNDPVYTYETNVMGTVNILECVRENHCVKSFLNVTTDKVYKNNEWEWGYRENEQLDGFEPYSNSKSCSELVTHSYKNSFFSNGSVAISTARAGNVIGGGDFANDRIVPDCFRAASSGMPITVRNRLSIRPYQHVLDPLFAYLMIAEKQYNDISYSGYYNVGPDECDCLTTGGLATKFCNCWGDTATWNEAKDIAAVHEANFLKLDCSKLKKVFNWSPVWGIDMAVSNTVEWYKAYARGESMPEIMDRQINDYYKMRKINA